MRWLDRKENKSISQVEVEGISLAVAPVNVFGTGDVVDELSYVADSFDCNTANVGVFRESIMDLMTSGCFSMA